MERYEDPTIARALGWDAEAVVARGRALRRATRDGRERDAASGSRRTSASIGAGAGGAVVAAELAEGGAQWWCSSRAPHHDPTASRRGRSR